MNEIEILSNNYNSYVEGNDSICKGYILTDEEKEKYDKD